MTTVTRLRERLPALALLAALAPALGGCFTDQAVTGSIYPTDVRERHPIVLTNAPRVLDLFPEGPAGLSFREREDLRAYLAEYRRYGDGQLAVQVPAGRDIAGSTHQAVAAVRASAGGRVMLSNYHPETAGIASPVRLSFRRLQARVSDRCGLWPQDLGVGDVDFSESNQPYWNLGCSLQSNVASQVADPVDLVRGRPETPPDTVKRMTAIAKLRAGTDPSTTFKQDGLNKISTAVGN